MHAPRAPPSADVRRAARDALLAVWHFQSRYPRPTGLLVHQPRPTDVLIATNPKSGTTLLQYMTYQIVVAAGGAPPSDPDGTTFTDINHVAPWVDFGPQTGNTHCPSNPRIFKTHTAAHAFDLAVGKFIFCVRDPLCFVGSYLDFIFDKITRGTVTDPAVRQQLFHDCVRHAMLGVFEAPDIELYGRSFYDARRSMPPWFRMAHWFDVTRSWIQPPRPNVLVLCYEHVVADLPRTVRTIASFIGESLSEHDVRAVASRCTKEAMLGDPRFHAAAEGRIFRLEGIKKVQSSSRDGFNRFRVRDEDRRLINEQLRAHTGYGSYAELSAAMLQRQTCLLNSLK